MDNLNKYILDLVEILETKTKFNKWYFLSDVVNECGISHTRGIIEYMLENNFCPCCSDDMCHENGCIAKCLGCGTKFNNKGDII